MINIIVQLDAMTDEDWVGENPLPPGFRGEAYPTLNALMQKCPINQSPIGIGPWRISRYADIVQTQKLRLRE